MKKLLSVLTLFTVVALPFISSFAEAADKKNTSPPQITFVGGYPLSSVSGVLRNIAEARGYIHDDKPADAGKALKEARLRLEFIREASPTARVRDYIWVAKKHLSYESSEKVMQDLMAADHSLNALGKTRFVEHARQYINKAMTSLENKNKEDTKVELELADKAIAYPGLDLPLSSAQEDIASAQSFLDQSLPAKADEALNDAEGRLQFVVADLYSPLPGARRSLWASAEHYANREYDAAKKDMKEAGSYLKKAVSSGDAETKTEAGKLLKDLDSIKARAEKREKGTKERIESLWERTKALAERDAEYTALVVRKAETVNQAKKDIINAKMHILYAEAYQLTTGERRKTGAELDKADSYLKNAMSQVDEATKSRLSAIDAEIKELKSELNKKDENIKNRYRDIEEKLDDLIYKG
jgi:hypothetical protein